MRRRAKRSSSQRPAWMSNSMVREAFDASVTCARPPVSCQTSHVSTVPKASLPASARALAPGTWSSIQAIFVPEKYASGRRPVRAWIRASCPSAESASQAAAVRRSSQTMAWSIGSPVARSQRIAVSRWLAMPMAAISRGLSPARASASTAAPSGPPRSRADPARPTPRAGRSAGSRSARLPEPSRRRRTRWRGRSSSPRPTPGCRPPSSPASADRVDRRSRLVSLTWPPVICRPSRDASPKPGSPTR